MRKPGMPVHWIKKFATWVTMAGAMMLLVGGGLVHAGRGEEVVQKLRAKYDKTVALSLRFERTFRWKLADEAQRSEGVFHLKKPDRFRLETASQTLVTDGKTTWIYIPSNRQVLVQAYRKELAMSSPEGLLNVFSEDYVPTYIRDERVKDDLCHVLVLKPKGSGTYIREVTAWVDPKIWFVRKVQYTDINGDISTYDLTSLEINPKLDDEVFTFEIPEGVEVVDLR